MGNANKYSQDGNFDLTTLELTVEGGDTIDLIGGYLDIVLYESLLTPTMSGNITIVDSNNIYNFEALGNGEEIFIEFNTTGSPNTIRYNGIVYKSSPPGRITEHASGIVLYFVSKELITSKRTLMEKAFDSEISNIVSETFKSIKNIKPLNVSDSKHIQKFVSAGHRPLQLINDVAGRAVSANNEYGYMFYENNQEFCFKPLQELYKQEPRIEYYYRNQGVFIDVKKKEEESFNAIQNYEITSVNDLLEQIDDGVYGSHVINLNLLEKDTVKNEYDNSSQFDSSKSLARFPNLRNNLINEDFTDRKEMRTWFENEPMHKSRFFNIREILNSQRFAANIMVFGNSATKAGDVIKCTLPVWGTEALNNDKVPDLYSGKCLVLEVKHVIERTNYTQTLKLIKDAFEIGY